ncbi:MAG: transposase, partial [Ruthenibacterium sp.]
MGGDELELPKRKPNRLKDYDYSQNGAYFITICTKDRSELLWMVGTRNARPQEPASLSEYGVVIEGAIQKITEHYPCISVPNYVVMPNHIHMILVVANDSGRAMRAPTIATV